MQAAIDEEEKKATEPAPSPLTASTSPSPFSFGTSAPESGAAASSAPAFTFGTNPPTAPAAAPSFGFGNGSSSDGAEKSKDDKPAEEEALKKVTSTRWCSLNDVMGKLDGIEQKFDLLLGTKQNQ